MSIRAALKCVAACAVLLAAAAAPAAASADATPNSHGDLTALANATRLGFMDTAILPGADPAARLSFARFADHSSAYLYVSGALGYVGWYDPFADSWLVSRWTLGAAGWTLDAVAPALPQDLAGSSAALPAADGAAGLAWTRRDADVRRALWRTHADRVAAFQRAARSGALAALFISPDHASAAGDVIAARQDWLIQGLTLVGELPGYGDVLGQLRQVFVTRTDQLVTDPVLRRRIDTLPAGVRQSLHPVMAFSGAGGATLAVQSPFAPGLVFFTRFAAHGAAGAAPVSLTAVSLMSKEPS